MILDFIVPLCLRVFVAALVYRNLLNLNELDTTLTELKAMAAEAYMGFRSPAVPKKG